MYFFSKKEEYSIPQLYTGRGAEGVSISGGHRKKQQPAVSCDIFFSSLHDQ